MLEKREFDRNEFRARLTTAVAVVSGMFSLVVFLLVLLNYLQVEKADPVDNLMITKMRQEYAALPQKDEALAERIRDLELLNRKAFFTSQFVLRTGATLLLIGLCTFMVSAKYAIRWRREKPKLGDTPTAEKEFLAYAESRNLIMWAGVVMLGVGLGTSLLTESAVEGAANVAIAPPAADAKGGAKEAAATAASANLANIPKWEDMEKNWPSFRGPGSNGIAHFTNAPTDFDLAANKGVKWKVDLTLPGANSPIIWDNKLFISSADDKTREVACYDVNDGKELWKTKVEGITGEPPAPPKVSEDTGFAAPTTVVHAGFVVAIFANGDLIALDMDGKKVWAQNVGLPKNHYGHSSSLVAYDKFVYIQLDQKTDAKLIAMNVADGKTAWTANRKQISWASPIVAQTEFGPLLILNSETFVDAYDPISGELKFSQECLSGEVAPSPAYSNGIVFAANEYATATGIQLSKGEKGVEAKKLWEFDEMLPEVASPVGDGERFYFGTAGGYLVCLDAKTGKKLWDTELKAGFYSSPVLVGDKLYIADKEGHLYIVKAAGTYELVAERDLGEPAFATPAFMDGRIYLRTPTHLYCIEQANA